MREAWRTAFSDRGFRLRLFIMLVTHAVFSFAFASFVGFVEERPGVVLPDPFLERLPLYDVTWPIFILIYVAVVVAFAALLAHPARLVLALQTWSGMLMLRMLAMYLVPLEPPANIIPLADPVAELAFGSTTPALKDLFFSGHTSTLLILTLTAAGRRTQVLFGGLTVVVATLVLVQRVHYTIDVVAAPFFVLTLFWTLRPWYLATSGSR